MVFFAFTNFMDVIFNPTGILNMGISLLLNPVASCTSVINFHVSAILQRACYNCFVCPCASIKQLEKCQTDKEKNGDSQSQLYFAMIYIYYATNFGFN
jgi:hypothetical protein